MIGTRYIPLVFKQLWRHRTRTLLTVAGVAAAMFLFVTVQTLQHGVTQATRTAAGDTTLVVYRENRFCPATSRLPEYYGDRIERTEGVAEVIPMKIVVSNCRASLDVITFRGVPRDDLSRLSGEWTLLAGSLDEWGRRSDAALVGELLAARRGFKVGESFDSSGVTVTVAGIIRSRAPQDQNVAYVHMDFLQQASRTGLGIVTQFNVKVSDPARLEGIAKAIDDQFRLEADPTTTRPEKAFVAQAGADIVELVGFTRYLGWACLAAVLGLVANAIVLSVQDRVKEHAILQTIGFRSGLIARLIVAESVLMGLAGGAAGSVMAWTFVHFGRFSLSTEGLSVNFGASPEVLGVGLAISAGVGVVAGLVPAVRASRREIAACFRAI
jgi:putative ABC transport system permease protein